MTGRFVDVTPRQTYWLLNPVSAEMETCARAIEAQVHSRDASAT
jgi:hypothetical protein